MENEKSELKVVLLGDSGTGKSSILMRFVADNFIEGTEPNIGASYMGKTIQYNDRQVKFNIWDTAGQERFKNLAKIYYRDADAAILVFDITSTSSFEGMKRWYAALLEYAPEKVAKVVAANKEDLIDQEEVTRDQATDFAYRINAKIRRTSAKTNEGIDQLFNDIASLIYPDITSQPPQKRIGSMVLSSIAPKKTEKKCC